MNKCNEFNTFCVVISAGLNTVEAPRQPKCWGPLQVETLVIFFSDTWYIQLIILVSALSSFSMYKLSANAPFLINNKQFGKEIILYIFIEQTKR